MPWAFDPKALVHERACASRQPRGVCDCTPTIGGKLYKTFSGKGAKSAAKNWRSDAVPQVRKGTLTAPTKVTLRVAWEDWISAAERGEVLSRFKRPYKPSALRGYRADMTNYVLEDLGERRLADITADDVQAIVERLNGKGLSGSKVRNVVIPLQALYRRNRRQVPIDPTDGDALDLPEVGGRRERVAQVAETVALLEALPEDLRPIYATAAFGGLRRGELRALRVSDVNDVYLWVERSWDDKAGVIEPKSKAGTSTRAAAGDAARDPDRARRAHEAVRGRARLRPHGDGAIHAESHPAEGCRGLRPTRAPALVLELPRRGGHLGDARRSLHGALEPLRLRVALVIESRALLRVPKHPLVIALVAAPSTVIEELPREELIEDERPPRGLRLRRAVLAPDE